MLPKHKIGMPVFMCRFKIYIEGSSWSVSEKYILACDSMTLMVTPHYYDFFTRGMMPLHHYWPIKMDDKCKSIKFAVEWGNNHEEKVQQIGKAASRFIQEDIKMDNVYDYMFHLLTAYSKLMKYKPTVPENATELCSETMACKSGGLVKQLMDQSTVKGPANVSPCIMQPPYDSQTLNSILHQKANSIKQVEKWEKYYFEQISQKNLVATSFSVMIDGDDRKAVEDVKEKNFFQKDPDE
ncbi:lipopolysaccharide-modifying protein [Artemisia annua]|uniref:Lipopolysaccharide-modifying protein n=1 Tax=Artemisia annua TaxID=35608 RepID=A0A2U1L059_ARTAN|nr:lipopolysaccharide-modifying protein [Artemisia annua]